MSSILEKILRFIQTVPMTEFDDGAFKQSALELFQYQFAKNTVYRGVCIQQNLAPQAITDWRDIPAVTTSAFKEVPLTSFPANEATAVFHTSGTTQRRSGKHYFRMLDFYRAAMLRSFAQFCLPPHNKMRLLVLGPTAEYFPHSSLGYMFSGLRDEFGDEHSASFFSPDGLDAPALQNALEKALREKAPVFILGTALALLECMEIFQRQNRIFKLPGSSRILDTGGYKGRRVEITREEFQNRLCETFNVPREYLLNEYGMTELSSQFYTGSLPGISLHADRRSGAQNTHRPSPFTGRLSPFALHFMPPWVRVVAVDPETLAVLPNGEIGLLRIFDLANVDSVMAIQTADLGRAWQDRIELLGRASGAELRGCSLLTEMISQNT